MKGNSIRKGSILLSIETLLPDYRQECLNATSQEEMINLILDDLIKTEQYTWAQVSYILNLYLTTGG